MDVQEELLQRFAKGIDLPAYLGARGFVLSEQRQPGTIAMTNHATRETLRLEKDVERGGWKYISADDPGDRGDVADFIARREGLTRVACVDRLAACCDERGRGSAEAARYRAYLRAEPDELASATREHEQAKLQELATNRALDRFGVQRGTLDEGRFGPVKSDTDVTRLVVEPSELWASKYRPGDKAVVLVERPIDAIAYERAHGRQSVCYLATGSMPSDEQRRKLAHLLAEVPGGTRVVLAFGRDEAGRRLAAEVQALAPLTRMERHAPELGARWADQMQLERRHALSMKRLSRGLER
jgi:hypothetical protein